MRIGFISTYPPIECGIAAYTQYLSDALKLKKNDVYVISHVGGSGSQVFPAFDYHDPDLAQKAYNAMVRFTPDVVHIQHEFGLYGEFYGVNVIPLLIRFQLTGIPVVTTLHTVYANPEFGHQVILKNLLLHSSRVIVHEQYQKETLIKLAPFPVEDKITVIAHGARVVKRVERAKRKLGLPEDKKVVLMIGYFRPSKNFERIVRLFPQILRQYPDAILVIAGKIRGNEHIAYRAKLFSEIDASPARDQIYLIRGQLEQKPFDTILSAADVVVLPYTINSQSGILAHALAFQRPIVASESGAMRSVLTRSGAGLVAGNDEDFVRHIVTILRDEKLAQRLSESAKNYVEQHIAWPLIAQKHMDLYSSLIHEPMLENRTIWVE